MGLRQIKELKDLMSAMRRHGMNKLKIQEGDYLLELEHQDGVVREVVTHAAAPAAPMPAANPIPAQGAPLTKAEEPAVEDEGDFVTSPIVGTFYSSSSPDTASFVKPGDKVDANTVVCIVEAMKVMNEVKAGISGTVAEVLVDNAHPVEFGTKLFRVV